MLATQKNKRKLVLVWMLRSALIGRCTEMLRRLRARRAVVGEKVGSVLEGLCSIRLSFGESGRCDYIPFGRYFALVFCCQFQNV